MLFGYARTVLAAALHMVLYKEYNVTESKTVNKWLVKAGKKAQQIDVSEDAWEDMAMVLILLSCVVGIAATYSQSRDGRRDFASGDCKVGKGGKIVWIFTYAMPEVTATVSAFASLKPTGACAKVIVFMFSWLDANQAAIQEVLLKPQSSANAALEDWKGKAAESERTFLLMVAIFGQYLVPFVFQILTKCVRDKCGDDTGFGSGDVELLPRPRR